jgi:hypothetical protein
MEEDLRVIAHHFSGMKNAVLLKTIQKQSMSHPLKIPFTKID